MCWNLLKVLVHRLLVEVCNVWNFWENSFGGFCAKRFNFRPIMKIEFSQIDAKLRRPPAQNFAIFQKCSSWCRGSRLKFLCNFIEYSQRTNTFPKNNTSKNRYWVYDLKAGAIHLIGYSTVQDRHYYFFAPQLSTRLLLNYSKCFRFSLKKCHFGTRCTFFLRYFYKPTFW